MRKEERDGYIYRKTHLLCLFVVQQISILVCLSCDKQLRDSYLPQQNHFYQNAANKFRAYSMPLPFTGALGPLFINYFISSGCFNYFSCIILKTGVYYI